MDGTDKDSRMTDSGELSSELISEFTLIVISEVNRRVMKYDREIFCMDLYVADDNKLVVETIDSEGAMYDGWFRISDPSPEVIYHQLIRMISTFNAAYSDLYRLERGIWM